MSYQHQQQYQQGPQGPGYPGAPPNQGPRFPTDTPAGQRGPSPPQHLQQRPPAAGTPQYQVHPGMPPQPQTVYTYHVQPGMNSNMTMQYHLLQPGQQAGQGHPHPYTQHPQQPRGPAPGNVMQAGAPPFPPGQPQFYNPPHSGAPAQPQVIYQNPNMQQMYAMQQQRMVPQMMGVPGYPNLLHHQQQQQAQQQQVQQQGPGQATHPAGPPQIPPSFQPRGQPLSQ